MEQEQMTLQRKIDEAANNWNKTKDTKYKKLWYKLIYGHYSFKRRSIPATTSIKTDSGWNSVDK